LKFLLLSLLAALAFASPAQKACLATGEGTPQTAFGVWMSALSTLYNIFPIKIGGVKIGGYGGLEDTDTVSSNPICVCMDPLPRIGLKVSLWEPIALVEVTAIPGCSPAVGLPLPAGLYPMSFGANTQGPAYFTYQAHYWKFPVFSLLELFLDFICLEKGGIDLAYVTEYDPLWQNDLWAAILNPEALLVANPVAQKTCSFDAAAANAGFPQDHLWWCLGSWGSLYPFTKTHGQTTAISAQMAVTAKLLAKLHREGFLWGSVGEGALCGKYPMPIMRKSQYAILPVHPVPHPTRIPIGRSELLWGEGKEAPLKNHHVFVNVIYRKRDCCAF